MRPDDLYEFTRKRPFMAFRIYVSDGETYDVRHPDQVIVLRSRIIIGVVGKRRIPEHVQHVSLIHITRIEELESEPSDA